MVQDVGFIHRDSRVVFLLLALGQEGKFCVERTVIGHASLRYLTGGADTSRCWSGGLDV